MTLFLLAGVPFAISAIDTFLDVVVKENFPLLSVGWWLFRVVSDNRYLPRGSNAIHILLLALVMYLFPDGNTSGNHTTFGFCHDSLNSLNPLAES